MIKIRLAMKSRKDGGRTSPLPSDFDFRCTVFFKGMPGLGNHGYDCRLHTATYDRQVSPGEVVDGMGITFLSEDVVLKHLKIGARFEIWEGKMTGEGQIMSIVCNTTI